MFPLILFDHVFLMDSIEDLRIFLDNLFSHAVDRKLLYNQLADDLKGWLIDEMEGDCLCSNPRDRDRGHVEALTKVMTELYRIYGVIYDPDGECYSLSDTGVVTIFRNKEVKI